MTKRYIPDQESGEFHNMTEAQPDEPDEETFVHYSDYETLVDAAREAVIDLDFKYEKSAKLHLEKALTSVGEEI